MKDSHKVTPLEKVLLVVIVLIILAFIVWFFSL